MKIKFTDIVVDLRLPRLEKILFRRQITWIILMIALLWMLVEFPDSSNYTLLLLMFGISAFAALFVWAITSVVLLGGTFIESSILLSILYSAIALLSWWDGEIVLAFSSIILGLFTALYLLGIEILTLSSSRALYVNVLIVSAFWSITLPLFFIALLVL